jgi:hypothetical protein
MDVLVTGGTGVLGRAAVQALVQAGHRVRSSALLDFTVPAHPPPRTLSSSRRAQALPFRALHHFQRIQRVSSSACVEEELNRRSIERQNACCASGRRESAFPAGRARIPESRAGSVRIKVQACGICHSDSLTRQGTWPGVQYPRVPGHQVAGIVDAVGAGTLGWKVGQRALV